MYHCEQTLFHQLFYTSSFSHDINVSYISVCFCLLLFHGRKWFIAHSQSESVDKRVDNEHCLSITSLFTPSLQQEKSTLNRERENEKSHELSLFQYGLKHCQRHNGPEGWVLIESSKTNLDQISSQNLDQASTSKSQPNISLSIKLKLQNLDQN